MSVLTYLKELARKLNIAENEASSINRSIKTIQARLDFYFSDQIQKHFKFGSSTRNTMLPRKADINSDVDYMIIFDNDYRLTPQTFLTKLKKFAEHYYSSSEIFQSNPSVVLELNHIKFDLVPAYEGFINYYIPAPNNLLYDWKSTNPFSLNDLIDDANKTDKYNLKPTIRIIKYWNAINGHIYDSYELEAKLAETWFFMCKNLKDYVYKGFNIITNYGWSIPDYKKNKLDSLHRSISYIKFLDEDNQSTLALKELKKLIPDI